MTATDPYDVLLNGRGYMLDLESGQYAHQSVPMLRQQSDTSNKPGEASLNPAGLWRRAVESWDHGAGQTWYDKPESDPHRFHASKGVDPWEKYRLGLLPATSLADSSTDTNLFLAVSGGRLYFSEGQTIKVTGVGDETFASATGLPAVAVGALTSDGSTCYAAVGASGIYSATGTVFASLITGTVAIARYVNGRLIATNGSALYNPVAAGALPAAFYTHPNASWTWTDATEGSGHIYLSGYAGDKSMVYRVAVLPDGTGLDVPVVAAQLPDGERAVSVTGYLGFVVVGTTLGVRFAVRDANGDLTLGALIPTGASVFCGEGQDRFVWYGLTNYDGTSTGLGRLDLTAFTSDLTPAYATDLMATAQGAVQSVATYLGRRWFTVSASGCWKQHATDYVASGTVTTGLITYGIGDIKNAVYADVLNDTTTQPGAEIALSVSTDGSSYASIGVSSGFGAGGAANLAWGSAGRAFELRATVTADAGLLSANFHLKRLTLRVDPVADRSFLIRVPLTLHDTVTTTAGDKAVDVSVEYTALDALWRARTQFFYKEGDRSWLVALDDYQWVPYGRSIKPGFYTGTYVATLKVLV